MYILPAGEEVLSRVEKLHQVLKVPSAYAVNSSSVVSDGKPFKDFFHPDKCVSPGRFIVSVKIIKASFYISM